MLIEAIEAFKSPMHIDGFVIARFPEQPDHPLGLAQGVGADQMGALGELLDRTQQAADLLGVWGMAKDRQAKGRLGDEDVAGHGFEGGAGRVAPTFVVARGGDGQACLSHGRLG
ncbi:hypothetical protein D3C72_1715800 [compost metagenome]